MGNVVSGRPLFSEEEAINRGFIDLDCARRRQVLCETINAFQLAGSFDHYHTLAKQNLNRWQVNKRALPSTLRVDVFADDWGEVTRSLSYEYGECFSVLNMANAFVPGGAYVEGVLA
jgi:hypothetical protein